MTKKRNKRTISASGLQRRRRLTEAVAVIGLLIVAVALIVPVANLTSAAYVSAFRWVYGSGALIYTIARVIDVTGSSDSPRLKRLRRMEFWAGVSFMTAAFFWFYNFGRFGAGYGGTLAIMRDTILFTLVGAMIEIIASWLIWSRSRKEAEKSV